MGAYYRLENIRALLTEGFTAEDLRFFCHDSSDFSPVYEQLAEGMGKDKIVQRLIEYANRKELFDPLLAWAKEQNPAKYQRWQPYHTTIPDRVQKPNKERKLSPASITQMRLFICYKQHADPDQKLATYLQEFLAAQGYEIFIDRTLLAGSAWLEEIDRQIKTSDFMVVLLSRESINSEMLQNEVRRAYEYRKRHGKPHTLPIRMAYEGLLPYSIDAFLAPLQYLAWRNETDNELVARNILAAIASPSPPKSVKVRSNTFIKGRRPIAGSETLEAPLSAPDPRFLKELPVPGGAVELSDKLYIEREADIQLKDQITRQGSTITIHAPRQTGKTSLLMRGIHWAHRQEIKVVFLDFQNFGDDLMASLDLFLQGLAQEICDELDLDNDVVKQVWSEARSAPKKLLHFMENYVLPVFEKPIVLAMDEADCLLQTGFYKEFFGLLRSWHNLRAHPNRGPNWKKLNLILVISTEPYLLIDNIYQSPFNVGLNLGLADFDEAQVSDLNRRHNSPVAESDLPQLIALLYGHPFLTRRALYTMVTQRMTWTDLSRIASTDHGPFGDHLRHQYWTIHDRPELRKALKEVIHTNHCADKDALLRLLRAGLVKGSGEEYTCRCGLYKLYFGDKL